MWDFIFYGEVIKSETDANTGWMVSGEESDIRKLWNLMAKIYNNSYFRVVDHKGNIRNE